MNNGDTLPPPQFCDVCCSTNVIYTTNDAVYGKQYGEWPWCYFCRDCRAAVGCHPDTNTPLGKMATKRTRQMRLKAHNSFDRLWREGLYNRNKAYKWLASALQIAVEECHISWLDETQLEKVIEVSDEHYKQNFQALLRRKEKQEIKRNEREQRQYERERTAERLRRKKAYRKPK